MSRSDLDGVHLAEDLAGPYEVIARVQAPGLDQLGRLVLAVGLGGRDDDYEQAGSPTTGRGRRLEELLEEVKRIWSGEERGYAGAIGPTPAREGGRS
jgi:hypothetical protein